jgi:hypothetical protein
VRLFLGICIVVSLAGGLWAAELQPGLDKVLQSAPPDSHLSVIVKLFNPNDIAALDQKLHAEKAPLALRHKTVIAALKDNAERTQGPVLARLDRMKDKGEVVGYTAYWIENLIVVLGNSDAILGLASDPAVESIGANFRAELIQPVRGPIRSAYHSSLDHETTTTGQDATGATRVNRELGITGHNRLIGGLDTGVMGSHPALHDRWRGLTHPLAECWLDLLGSSPAGPTDGHGHGTHTMGTMCGRAIVGNDTNTVGAAPDAEWIACNAINQGVGGGFDQDILDAFQWFTDPDGNPNTMDDVPDVIQNSWGVYDGLGYPSCFSNWNTAITNCEAAGPVVTWSAGNEGPGAQTLRSPANYQLSPTDIFSVGAVDLSLGGNPPYPIASFSSRGPSGCAPNPAAIKPEIVAPGVHVYSSYNDGTYTYMDGTSMAGPHVAGIVALMREACPDCDAETIKDSLLATAIDYGTAGDDNTFGHGFVNAYAAVQSVYALAWVDGYVTSGGSPLPGARVDVVNTAYTATTDTSGHYTVRVQGEGTYSVRYSKFGYSTHTETNVQTVVGDTTYVAEVSLSPVPNGVLLGTVALQSGIPARNARVEFPGTPVADIFSDSLGHFVVTLPATSFDVHLEYVLNISPPLGLALDTTITVNTGDTTRVLFTLWVELAEPSMADAYGYRVYDRYDRDLPCPWDWTELDPGASGSGTLFGYSNGDSSAFFRAPFPISFYGQLSDSMTVNCNGWMLPGIHHQAGKVDHAIPFSGDTLPPGIIAPFWNDIVAGLGARQFQGYDSTTGRWIFEFLSQHLVWPGNYPNSWQVQILDPAFTPTATGDCEIHFIYGSMGWLTGSTIGIENPTQTTGIQMRHDTTVADWSWPIANGSSMRITTGLATHYGHATVNVTLYPAPANGTALTAKVGGRTVTGSYGSALVSDSIPAAPVSAVLATAGYEMGRADRVTVPQGGNANFSIQAWRLDPPREVTGSQAYGVVTLQWRRPLSVETQPYTNLRYSVYRDGVLRAQALSDTVFADQTLPQDSTVSYVVKAEYRYGRAAAAPLMITIDLPVSTSANGLPTVYQLYPAYPNPFNPDTRIRFDLPMTSSGRLDVYDIEGRLVRTLWSGDLAAGRYEYSWNSTDNAGHPVASGLYFCRFSSAHYTATQKMMLLK